MTRQSFWAKLPLILTMIVLLLMVVFDTKHFMMTLSQLTATDQILYLCCLTLGLALYKRYCLPPTFKVLKKPVAQCKHRVLKKCFNQQLLFQWRCLKRALPTSHRRFKLVGLMGMPGSGRQSLLKATDQFVQITQPSATSLPFDLDWWYGEHHIVCVCAPTLAESLSTDQQTLLLKQLQRFLKRRWWQHPWHALYTLLPIATLKTKSSEDLEREMQALNQALTCFKHPKQTCPLHVLFGQMDHVAGFAPFFEHLDAPARQQLWRLSLKDMTTCSLVQFEKPFREWVGVLHTGMMKRLHHESQHHRLCLIKDFPIQLEKLKEPMFWWLSQLAIQHHYVLDHLMFVSAKQDGRYIDFLRACLLKDHAPTQPCQASPFGLDQSYFCHQVWQLPQQKIVTAKTEATTGYPQYFVGLFAALLLAGLLALGRYGMWLHAWLHAQTQSAPAFVIPESQAPLWAQYQHATDMRQWQRQHPLPKILGHVWLPWSQQLRQHHQTWQQALIQEAILKTYHQQFAQQLLHAKSKLQRHVIFANYRTILLDNDPHKMALQQWLRHSWQSYLPPKVLQQRMTLLKELLPHITPPTLSHELVNWTQQQFAKLSWSEEVHLWLSEKQPQTMPWPKQLRIFQRYHPEGLPQHLSAASQHALLTETIPKMCLKIAHERNVLGPLRQPETALKSCIQQSRRDQLHRYIAFWSDLYQHIGNTASPTITQIAETWQDIGHTPLAIQKQSQRVQQALQIANMYPNLLTHSDQEKLAYIKDTNHLLHDMTWQTTLEKAGHVLSAVREDETNKKGFDVAIATLNPTQRQNAIRGLFAYLDDMPTQLQQHFKPLAEQAWHTILQSAGHHIDAVWQVTVRTYFTQHMVGHFPFHDHAQTDTTLGDFSRFFKPKTGIVDLFTTHYLQPFVILDANGYRPKTFAGHGISFTPKLFHFMDNNLALQAMFFAKGPLNVDFSVVPIQWPSASAHQTYLDLLGKHVRLDSKKPAMLMMHWPTKQETMMGLMIENQAGQHFMMSRQGPWAIFRMLNRAKRQTSTDPSLPQLRFKIHHFHVTLAMMTPTLLNPLQPHIFSAYKVPEHIWLADSQNVHT